MTWRKASLRFRKSGFSLVEVTLAIGIFSFCVLAVVGLMSVALDSAKNSERDSATIAILRYLDAQLRQETEAAKWTNWSDPAANLPSVGKPVYFDLTGKPVDNANNTDTVYRADILRVPANAAVNNTPELKEAVQATDSQSGNYQYARPLYLWSVTVAPARAQAGSAEEKKYLLGHTLY